MFASWPCIFLQEPSVLTYPLKWTRGLHFFLQCYCLPEYGLNSRRCTALSVILKNKTMSTITPWARHRPQHLHLELFNRRQFVLTAFSCEHVCSCVEAEQFCTRALMVSEVLLYKCACMFSGWKCTAFGTCSLWRPLTYIGVDRCWGVTKHWRWGQPTDSFHLKRWWFWFCKCE